MKLTKLTLVTHLTISLITLANPIIHSKTDFTGDPTQPVTTDFYHFQWNLWWIQHSLSTGQETYRTHYILNPHQSNLTLHTLTASAAPIWAATINTLGPSGAILTIFIIGLTLTGFCTTAFLQKQQTTPILAITGGILVQSSAIMFESSKWTTINLMGWFWLPLILLTWQQLVQNAQKRRTQHTLLWTTLLGVSLWAMILTDLQYPLFLAFLIIPYTLWTLYQSKNHHTQLAIITASITSILIAVCLLWFLGPLPYLLNYNISTLASTPATRAPSISFPTGFLWRLDHGISLGAAPAAITLTALLLWARKRKQQKRSADPQWLWLAIAIPPLILSAGVSITVLGREWPLPYLWLHTGLSGIFRYPERFANVFLIAILAFTLPFLSHHMPRQNWRRYAASITLLILVLADTRAFRPVPLQPIPEPYSFYESMGQEAYDYVIVEIPTAGSSGEGIVGRSEWVALQWYGIIHGKRMVNAHISRVDPWYYLWMETSDAMMSWLGQRRYLEPELVTQQMAERIPNWPIGYFIIHSKFLPQNGPTLQEIVGFFNAHNELVCPYMTEHDAIVYRTTWHPDGCPARTPPETAPRTFEIDIGVPGDERFIGWGWHWQEDIGATQWRWTGEYPETRLYVDLPPGSYHLTLAAQAFWEARTLHVSVNGVTIPETAVVSTDSLRTYEFALPASLIDTGEHIEITLNYDKVIVPLEVGQSQDPRALAIAVDWIQFRAEIP